MSLFGKFLISWVFLILQHDFTTLGDQALEISEVEADSTCFGQANWINDDYIEDDWQEDGFGDCSNGTDGFVWLALTAKKFVSVVQIFTPFSGHMRNDYYKVEVCEETCKECDPLPATLPGEWSKAMCAIVGTDVVLSKKVATTFQLVEVDVFGSDLVTTTDSPKSSEATSNDHDHKGSKMLKVSGVHSQTTCFGETNWINDDFTEDDWSVDGFGDCSKGIKGWVRLSLTSAKLVSHIAIFTPFTGHARNDYYRAEVCLNTVCNECGRIPATSPGEWSEAECGFVGNGVLLTKRKEARFELVEVDVFGSDPISYTESVLTTMAPGIDDQRETKAGTESFDLSMEIAEDGNQTVFDVLEISGVHSDSICFGELGWIHDELTEDDWSEDGFGDCSEGTDGWVRLSLSEVKFVSHIAIYTPFTGHTRNDYYELNVCLDLNCTNCDPVPATASGDWSHVPCGINGDEIVLTKRVATTFQLVEVTVFGAAEGDHDSWTGSYSGKTHSLDRNHSSKSMSSIVLLMAFFFKRQALMSFVS